MAQTVNSQITLIPGNLIVGTNLAAEYIRVTNTTGASATTVDLTFTPVAKFAETPAVVGVPLLTPGSSSATKKITSWYVKSQSATTVTITVVVDAAAGAGKDNTITMAAVLIGPQAWK